MPPKRKAAAKGSKGKAAAASAAATEENATDTSVLDASTISELDTSSISNTQDAAPVDEPAPQSIDAPVAIDITEPSHVSKEATQASEETTQQQQEAELQQQGAAEEVALTVDADQSAAVEQSTTPTIEPTDGHSSDDSNDDEEPRSKRAKGDDTKERTSEAAQPDFTTETELKPEPEPLPDKDQLIQQTMDEFHLGATLILSNLPALDAVEGKSTEELYLESLSTLLAESEVQPASSVFTENRECDFIPIIFLTSYYSFKLQVVVRKHRCSSGGL